MATSSRKGAGYTVLFYVCAFIFIGILSLFGGEGGPCSPSPAIAAELLLFLVSVIFLVVEIVLFLTGHANRGAAVLIHMLVAIGFLILAV